MAKISGDMMLAGALTAVVADRLWFAWSGHTIYMTEGSPLAFIEHHHWALLLTLLDSKGWMRGAGLGAAAVLLASETLQENPFGYGKTTFPQSVGLTVALLGLNAILWFGPIGR